MKPNFTIAAVCALLSILDFQFSTAFAQGGLTPPGAPAPSMKSLDQIQPRTPISSPVAITQPGSYYLTTNIIGPYSVTILSSDVTLDLNGFTITITNSSDGIDVYNPPIRNLRIYNGTVSHCGGNGIYAFAAQNSQFDHLRVEGNGIYGLGCGDNCQVIACNAYSNAASLSFNSAIVVGNNSVVKDCVADANRGIGIVGGNGTAIIGCATLTNLGAGINVGTGSTVRDCTAVNNSGQGISVGDSSVVSFCTAQTNSSDGIAGGIGCTINACSAVSNVGSGFKLGSEDSVTGCTASQNNGDGIQVSYSCLVQGNTCNSNSRFVTTGGAGVHAVNSGNRIDGNVLNSDQYGVKADGNENIIVRNTARASTSVNYYIAAGNMVGIITNAISTSGTIFGSNGGSGLGTSDPWANFSY